MWDFFEQPWTLLGAAVVVLFGVLTFRSVWYEKRRAWQWLLPVGVALLGVGLDVAVTTDLEKINAALKSGVQAVEAEDVGGIDRLIASDYRDSRHTSKESLMSLCRVRLTPPAAQRVRKISRKIEIAGPEARADLSLWFTFDKDSFWAQAYKPTALIAVRIYFRKQPDKSWLVGRTEVVELDKTPISWGMVE